MSLSTYIYPGAWIVVTQEALRASTPNGQFEKLDPKVKKAMICLATNLESNQGISIIKGKKESVVFFPAGTMSVDKVRAFAESEFAERTFSSDPWSYTRSTEIEDLSGRKKSYFVTMTRDMVISNSGTSPDIQNCGPVVGHFDFDNEHIGVAGARKF